MIKNTINPIKLEIYKHLFASIAEEMGVVLRKASFSPNIKERRDFSCAIFNSLAKIIAQAAHIPVHLGSMPLSVIAAVNKFQDDIHPGDIIILNDPFLGGTHLPDITLVTPVFTGQQERLFGFVASRAHHADVGGITPGSMPLANEIYQEGLIIPPLKLSDAGNINQALLDLILRNVRTPQERLGDLYAQIAANECGASRLQEMIIQHGEEEISCYMQELLSYTERITRQFISTLPKGRYEFQDVLDDDGLGTEKIPICVSIEVKEDRAVVDFTGSAPQQETGVNAVFAITLSAVYYVIRSLLGFDIPNNAGCLEPIELIAPPGSILNALPPSPVAGGNVETSQRIVDVLLGALAKACPDKIPAASQGTMNNLTIGGWDIYRKRPYTYYETIGGGMGASPGSHGASAIHSHMTNTLNTPIEALEYTYPLRVRKYEIRHHSGGEGFFHGGDGLCREIEILCDSRLTLLTDRRKQAPYGLAGGDCGQPGRNFLIHDGHENELPGKGTFTVQSGDVIGIHTPGGGGWGLPHYENNQ
jgi:N-methylhydantoinase B